MRAFWGAIAALALVGCATAPQYPAMRPLTQAHIDELGATPIVVSETNAGIEKSWFYTSTASAGAAYGLIGVLVTTAMDAIINAGPSRRAQKAANEMAELMPVETLNASLVEHLRARMPGAAPVLQPVSLEAAPASASPADGDTMAAPAVMVDAANEAAAAATPTGVHYAEVRSEQPLLREAKLNDAIDLAVRYTLSEDSSTLRVIATASYENSALPYVTPYSFEGEPPRAEREGPLYRNTFTYYSQQLEVPTLTPELVERLVASIEDSARDESGALPAEGSDAYASMQREIENARDERLTKDEIAIFLTREWLRDDGALLRREIEQAHAFIASYVALDMNRTATPSLAGADELLETMEDQRTVRRIGSGVDAGSYVSSAGQLKAFSTYGNAISIARLHSDRISALRSAARAQ